MVFKCRTSQVAASEAADGRKRIPWKPNEVAALKGRKAFESARLKQVSAPTTEQAAKAADIEASLSEWEALTTTAHVLRPDQTLGVESFFARQFGKTRDLLGLGDELTVDGAVRQNLLDVRRTAEGMVDYVAKFKYVSQLRDMTAVWKEITSDLNLTREVSDAFFIRVVEEGQIPRKRMAYGNSDTVNHLLDNKYHDFVREARDLGITPDQLDDIVERSMTLSTIIDEVNAMAHKVGVPIDPATNYGAFARTLDSDTMRKLEVILEVDRQVVGRTVGATVEQRIRSTQRFTIEDGMTLSEMLTPGSTSSWNAYLRKATGLKQGALDKLPTLLQKENPGKVITLQDIQDEWTRLAQLKDSTVTANTLEDARKRLISESGGVSPDDLDALNQQGNLSKYLHDNLTTDQVDSIVDAGILGKMPNFTSDLADYMVHTYQLPMTKRGEVFVGNYTEALNKWTANIQSSIADSSLVKYVFGDEAKQAGWYVDTATVNSNPGTYDGWRTLDELPNLPPNLKYAGADKHIHPIVFNQMEGILNLGGTNKGLYYTGAVFQYFNKMLATNAMLFSGGTLLGVPYVTKQAYSGLKNMVVGGGNPVRMMTVANKLKRVMQNGYDALDDTVPFVKDGDGWLTEREAFKQAMIYRGHGAIPQQGGERLGSQGLAYAFSSPLRMTAATQDLVSYFRLHGNPLTGAAETLGYAADKLGKVQTAAFQPFAAGAVFIDTVARIALAESVAGKYGVSEAFNKAQRLVTSNIPEPKTWKEALEHTDNYFVDFENLGETDRFIGKYVRPFASFALKNPMMMTRYAMRKPSVFMAEMRLKQYFSDDHEDRDVTVAGFAKQELAQHRYVLHYDKKTGEVTTLYNGAWDTMDDALSFGKQMGTSLTRISGKYDDVPANRNDDVTSGGYTFAEAFRDLVAPNTNWVVQAGTEALTGKDNYTGKPLEKTNTLLGATVNPDVAWLLKKVPLIKGLDTAQGGRGRVTGDYGEEVAPAEPGLFGTPTYDATDAQKSRYRIDRDNGGKGLRVLIEDVLGLSYSKTSIPQGNQKTYMGNSDAIRELTKQLSDPRANINTDKREKLTAQIAVLSAENASIDERLSRMIGMSGQDYLKLDHIRRKAVTKAYRPELEAKQNKAIQNILNKGN